MAISQGVFPHKAWISVDGQQFPVESGACERNATKDSSTFSGIIPYNYPGALSTLANLGGNKTTVIVLSKGQTATLLTGEIKAVEIELPSESTNHHHGGYGHGSSHDEGMWGMSGGAGTIHVSGQCNQAKLGEGKTHEKLTNMTTADVVKKMADEAGVQIETEGTSGLMAGKFVQKDWTKLNDSVSWGQVIHKLAELDGVKVWTDRNGVVHYAINQGGEYTLTYSAGPPIKADFLSLRVTRNIEAGKEIDCNTKSWDPQNEQDNTGQCVIPGNGGPLKYEYRIPNLPQDHVQKYAESKAKEVARHEYTVVAECVGDPSIDVNMKLKLSGTQYFDQSYDIDKITDKFGMGGHTMTITARSAKKGRDAKD